MRQVSSSSPEMIALESPASLYEAERALFNKSGPAAPPRLGVSFSGGGLASQGISLLPVGFLPHCFALAWLVSWLESVLMEPRVFCLDWLEVDDRLRRAILARDALRRAGEAEQGTRAGNAQADAPRSPRQTTHVSRLCCSDLSF